MEEKIQQELEAKFEALKGHIRIQRARRIFVEVPDDGLFPAVFDYAVKALEFGHLLMITGLDEGAVFGVLYHLARGGVILTLKRYCPRENPVIKTITPYFPAGDNYERELVDLLGIRVEDLPPGPRYPLPENWPAGEYPLRKDWKKNDECGMMNADTEKKP